MTIPTRARRRTAVALEEEERFIQLYGPLLRECLRVCDGDVLAAAKLLRGRALSDRHLWVALHGDTPEGLW